MEGVDESWTDTQVREELGRPGGRPRNAQGLGGGDRCATLEPGACGHSRWKQVRRDKRGGFCLEQEGDVVRDALCGNESGVHQAGETRGREAR